MSEENKAGTATEGEATVPSFRLREETAKRQKIEESLKAAMQTIQDLQEKFGGLEKTHAATVRTHGQDVSLLSVGVSDPEVREFVRSRWNPTDEKETFDQWLETQRENPSPLLRPFLQGGQKLPEAPPVVPSAPEVEVQEETQPPAISTPTGNPNAGTSQPAAHNGKAWGYEEIVNASRKAGVRGGLGEAKEAILAQLRSEGAIR